MSSRVTQAAGLPPAGIIGLNPAWSRLVTVADAYGDARTWHLLDTWADRTSDTKAPAVTLLCVHGNPSWSFLWRHVLSAAPQHVRVVAVDHLDMGFSERTGVRRTLATRVSDLCLLTEELGLSGSVVTLAHDWGGPISLGWALQQRGENIQTSPATTPAAISLDGVILTNTAVHQPKTASAPAVIRFIRLPILLKLLTMHTRAFIRGAIKMSKPALAVEVGEGFYAPYLHASRRAAIADFVADIPLQNEHESAATLDGIAAGLEQLADTPALLVWGPRDRVFNDLYLHDLKARLPHADVHRFPQAAHFVTEDADVAGAVFAWLSSRFPPVGSVLNAIAGSAADSASVKRRALADFTLVSAGTAAVVEPGVGNRTINFGELSEKVHTLAAGMAAFGILPGKRVAVMIMPGVDLCIVVYACWRLGATLVLVDSGLGKAGMQSALLGAKPDYLIGIDKALVAARLLGWPGCRIALTRSSPGKKRALNIVTDIDALVKLGAGKPFPAWPTADTVAALAFTSGSTGPSKGVVYLHRQIEAQRDALMKLYGIGTDDRLVAAFAPFALYGPTMGITSMVPDMDVTRPGTLTAKALVEAVEHIKATLVFASPAALVNVVATHEQLAANTRPAREAVRLALSAGAPVRASLLEAARAVFPNASLHTPYGMTEVLPVASISLEELKKAGLSGGQLDARVGDADYVIQRAGVCVGFPLNDVQITIDPLDEHGRATGMLTQQPDVMGEIIVFAGHIRHGYDQLWFTEHLASQPVGSHRTGDVGQLDADGRLWVGGRLGHVIVTPDGPLAPVACEQIIETIDGVHMAALVGVGPLGTQVAVAVVQTAAGHFTVGEASLELVDLVRLRLQSIVDIACVLVVKRLPVDQRHNSKVDRTAVAHWASRVLAGDSVKSL